ncbi:MAG: hypothetical protein EBW94_05910 [Proteobacteria bacterium]|nr:hypothetical protein [Pseudomonadota bacterium]
MWIKDAAPSPYKVVFENTRKGDVIMYSPTGTKKAAPQGAAFFAGRRKQCQHCKHPLPFIEK